MYIVFHHKMVGEVHTMLFGGLFTKKETAEGVVKRENKKLGKTDKEWYDFIKVKPDEDFLNGYDHFKKN